MEIAYKRATMQKFLPLKAKDSPNVHRIIVAESDACTRIPEAFNTKTHWILHHTTGENLEEFRARVCATLAQTRAVEVGCALLGSDLAFLPRLRVLRALSRRIGPSGDSALTIYAPATHAHERLAWKLLDNLQSTKELNPIRITLRFPTRQHSEFAGDLLDNAAC